MNEIVAPEELRKNENEVRATHDKLIIICPVAFNSELLYANLPEHINFLIDLFGESFIFKDDINMGSLPDDVDNKFRKALEDIKNSKLGTLAYYYMLLWRANTLRYPDAAAIGENATAQDFLKLFEIEYANHIKPLLSNALNLGLLQRNDKTQSEKIIEILLTKTKEKDFLRDWVRNMVPNINVSDYHLDFLAHLVLFSMLSKAEKGRLIKSMVDKDNENTMTAFSCPVHCFFYEYIEKNIVNQNQREEIVFNKLAKKKDPLNREWFPNTILDKKVWQILLERLPHRACGRFATKYYFGGLAKAEPLTESENQRDKYFELIAQLIGLVSESKNHLPEILYKDLKADLEKCINDLKTSTKFGNAYGKPHEDPFQDNRINQWGEKYAQKIKEIILKILRPDNPDLNHFDLTKEEQKIAVLILNLVVFPLLWGNSTKFLKDNSELNMAYESKKFILRSNRGTVIRTFKGIKYFDAEIVYNCLRQLSYKTEFNYIKEIGNLVTKLPRPADYSLREHLSSPWWKNRTFKQPKPRY